MPPEGLHCPSRRPKCLHPQRLPLPGTGGQGVAFSRSKRSVRFEIVTSLWSIGAEQFFQASLGSRACSLTYRELKGKGFCPYRSRLGFWLRQYWSGPEGWGGVVGEQGAAMRGAHGSRPRPHHSALGAGGPRSRPPLPLPTPHPGLASAPLHPAWPLGTGRHRALLTRQFWVTSGFKCRTA